MNAPEPRPSQPLSVWLDVLQAVMPPRGTLVVGAGTGAGPWVQWLRASGVTPVWLVEGDEPRYQHLVRQLPPDEGWTPRRDVVSGTSQAANFYRASNPAESGLLAPDRLKALWPNLTVAAVEALDATVTLDSLAAEAGNGISWLVLDCLPAGALLQGGAQLLSQVDVALVRVVVGTVADMPSEATHAEATRLLQAAGLRCIRVEAERHPSLAMALYTRNRAWLGAELQAAQAGWVQDKEAAEQSLREYEQQRAAWQVEKEALRQERQALEQARDQVARHSEARLAQIQALEKRIRDLLAHQSDMPPRGGSFEDELAKAEAQIDLLRSLLLPDPRP